MGTSLLLKTPTSGRMAIAPAESARTPPVESTQKIKNILVLDFETYYSDEYSLRQMTPPEYILDPRFAVTLLAAYDIRWPAPRIIEAHEIAEFLRWYPSGETMAISHNALFDMSILSWRYGWVPTRMADTLGLVRALRRYKRNSLGAVAKELFGTDTKGDVLPRVKGMNVAQIKRAGLWGDYRTYAMNDARLCAQIYFRLYPEFPVEEQQVMDLVLRAAVQPVLHADSHMLQVHLDELRKRKAQILRECGYDKAALMSTLQFKEALEELGVEVATKVSPTGRTVPAFSKTDPFMSELLEYQGSESDDVNYQVQTLANARLQHKSTIEETRAQKFVNIARLPWETSSLPNGPADTSVNGRGISAGLLPVALRYGGAHTHRLSGEWGLNMQNLPRDKAKSKLRSGIVAPPGHQIVTADLAQIEARIVAYLCGQADLVAQFRRGEDVYANFGTRLFAKPVDKVRTPNERWIAKTAILGLGYGCGVERFFQMVITAARSFGILLDGLFDHGVAKRTVATYRETFARIPAAWNQLEQSRILTINGRVETAIDPWGPVTIKSGRIELPNGLKLIYDIGDMSLYGAKILENITQALARIVVMQAAIRLTRLGYRMALQAHDELVFVVPINRVEVARRIIFEEMTRAPAWMPGVPLAVEIGVGSSYGEAK
jgi:DNA polymerase family A